MIDKLDTNACWKPVDGLHSAEFMEARFKFIVFKRVRGAPVSLVVIVRDQ